MLFNIKNSALLAMLLATLGAPSVQANTDLVSASDAQHFEQTYEDWTKGLIKSVSPKLEFTVLSEVEFSRNPERLQDYEDIKAANHLPGLPDISDPNYTNPLDSPLYALVVKRSFKVIFYSAITQDEIDAIHEVLNSKLKLNANDSLAFEHVNRNPMVKKGLAIGTHKTAIFSLVFGCALLIGAFFLFNHRIGLGNRIKAKLTQAEALPPATNPKLQPAHLIQMASTETLKKVLEKEKPELIARASLNATKKFSNYILGECEQSKFDLIIQWINANHKTVSRQDSNYARLLLSARLQQVQNESVLSSIEAFNKIRKAKLKLMASRPIYTIQERPEISEARL